MPPQLPPTTWQVSPDILGPPQRRVVESGRRCALLEMTSEDWVHWVVFVGIAAGTVPVLILPFHLARRFWVEGAPGDAAAAAAFGAVVLGMGWLLRARSESLTIFSFMLQYVLSPFDRRPRTDHGRKLRSWPCGQARVVNIHGGEPDVSVGDYRDGAPKQYVGGKATIALVTHPDRTWTFAFEAPLAVGDEVTVLCSPEGAEMLPVRLLSGVRLK